MEKLHAKKGYEALTAPTEGRWCKTGLGVTQSRSDPPPLPPPGFLPACPQAGLSITRAKVRTFATSNSSGHTFYVMGADGSPPDSAAVQLACQKIGGKMVEASGEGGGQGGGRKSASAVVRGAGGAEGAMGEPHRFSYSFMQRELCGSWGLSPTSSSCGST